MTSNEEVANLMDLAIEKFGQLNICVASAGIIKDGLIISLDKDTTGQQAAMARSRPSPR